MIAGINQNFRIVFTPKDREKFGGRRRFLIGGFQIGKYIGKDLAVRLSKKATNSKLQVFKEGLRKQGRIQFYSK